MCLRTFLFGFTNECSSLKTVYFVSQIKTWYLSILIC